MLTVGGLFSGIGGWELGLERAGMRVSWHCEADPYAQRVLERHWPGIPCYPDVRELRGADVEPVDVLAGGFPCQDLSVAGSGAGLDGERSGLWSEFARLIGELRPRYVLVENVAALLGRGLGRVLGDLAALGYDAEWDCIPASAVGAPHQRDRIWLVAYPSSQRGGLGEPGDRRQGRQSASPRQPAVVRQENGSGCPEGSTPCDPVAANPQSFGRGQRRVDDLRSHPKPASGQARPVPTSGAVRGSEVRGHGYWASEPRLARLVHGVPNRVDHNRRRHALGNALVPQIAEWIGRRIVAYETGVAT